MFETLFLTALAALSLLVAIGPPWVYSRWKLRTRAGTAAPTTRHGQPPIDGAAASRELI